MGMVTFILRNMLGRRVRTTLTVLGLGVGIAAVMMLAGISRGFEKSMMAIYQARDIDLIVVRAGVSDQLSSNLDIGLGDRLRAIPGVASIAPSLMDTVSFEDANLTSVLANGWEPGGLLAKSLRIVKGKALQPTDRGQVMLGRVLAMNLSKTVGQTVSIAGETFQVVAIYESDSLFENGGLVIRLDELQHMMGREGKVTGFVIVAKPDVDPRSLGDRIEAEIPGIAAVPARDYVQNNVQIRLARSMAVATTAVAIILGSIGLLNTMAMAVFERTGEIGLLRALGWRRRRIVFLLQGEALTLGILGSIVGSILAVSGLRLLWLSPRLRGFIDPELPFVSFAIGLLMGLGLSVLGGLYPAIRASRLEPIEALRHE